MKFDQLQKEFRKLGSAKSAKASQRFFKTAPGEYAHGVQFLGISVPKVRSFSKKHKGLPRQEVQKFLHSPYNDERLLALLILNAQFDEADSVLRNQIVKFYLKNKSYVNNWNLVDASAHLILGEHLLARDRGILLKLAKSKNLWDRRIAVIATLQFIRCGEFSDTLKLCEVLIKDKEDLMHKACGWMLRELGKKDQKALEKFLNRNAAKMPRTMLRYSIERMTPEKRKKYLNQAT